MNTIFAALLGLPTGKMNYHNIICRLSAPIQFHSEINEQLLGVIRGSVLSPQAPCGWAEPWQTNRWPWPGWGASTGLHTGSKYHIQTSRKAQITWKLWRQILAELVFWYNGDARVCCQVVIKTKASSHTSWTVIGHMGKMCHVSLQSWAELCHQGAHITHEQEMTGFLWKRGKYWTYLHVQGLVFGCFFV